MIWALIAALIGIAGFIVLVLSMVMVKGSEEPVPSEHIDMVI